eukprot:TRINITY_DN99098_c0_g1_i1.p1 TRINITY_DN99098_c0_g1~~TRINITY_DN99098_c0_g1_i1.p1  ORF type:complete len:212 (-),score=34.71 TRINITY_DN99098_c0_g1_i1:8-643(-)
MVGILVAYVQNTALSAFMSGLSDVLCQQTEMRFRQHKKEKELQDFNNSDTERKEKAPVKKPAREGCQDTEYDFQRTRRYITCAGLVGGSLNFCWFYCLMPKVFPSHDLWTVLLKDVLTNTAGVAASAAITFGVNNNLEGRDLKYLKRKLKRDIPKVVGCALAFWGPLQFLMFASVPAHMHVAYISTGTLIFSSVISHITFSEAAPAQPKPP